MARYIDADLLKSKISLHSTIQALIDKLPTADVRPERHGRWIFGEFDVIGRPVWCSECGSRTKYVADPAAWINYPEHKYCGYCGTKMDRKDGKSNDN